MTTLMPTQTELINLSIIQELMVGDPINYQKILKELIISTIANTEKMYINFYDKNWKGIKLAAHTLKSNAKYIGNEELISILKKIEFESEVERNYENTTVLVDRYKKLWTVLRAELSTLLQSS